MTGREQGPVPQSVRPPGVGNPPAGEVAFVGLLLAVLPAGLGDSPWWLPWLLRGAGAIMIGGFVWARIRYRLRRGEGVWLWHRI